MPGFAEELQALCERGQIEKAVRLLVYHTDELLAPPPTNRVYFSLLRACTKAKCPSLIRIVHSHLDRHRSAHLHGLLGDYLVVSLAKCGAVDEARRVFDSLSRRTVFSWTAMISGFLAFGYPKGALQMYHHMLQDDVEPDQRTFVALLKACASIPDLLEARSMHGKVRQHCLASNVYVATTLIHTYGKCGSIVEAECVFQDLLEKNDVSWNAMMTAYLEQEDGERALRLYRQMQEEGVCANEQTLVISYQAMGLLVEKEEATYVDGQLVKSMSLEVVRALHANANRQNFTSNVFVSSTLVRLYAKCGSIVESEVLFEGRCMQSIMLFYGMISAYIEHDQGERALLLWRQMQEEGGSPCRQTLLVALQACITLTEKKTAINLDGRSSMPLDIGKALHVDACRSELALDVFVGSTILNMYGKCGSILDAEDMFIGFSQRNVVSWTVMLSAYIEQEDGYKALRLYRQMQEERVSLNSKTFVIVLQACSNLVEDCCNIEMPLEIGKSLHADARRRGLGLDNFVCNTLVSVYNKCGGNVEARNVFDGLFQRDVVSYNAMLAAYIVKQNQEEKALQLYVQMLVEGLHPDQQTFVLAFQACSVLAMKTQTGSDERGLPKAVILKIGQELHADASKYGATRNNFVTNTLISMYSKFGCIREAEKVFHEFSHRNHVTWNALLSAYVDEGTFEKALQLYRQMLAEDVDVSKQMFVVVLQACSAILSQEEVLMGAEWETKGMLYEFAQAFDADALKKGLTSNVFIGSSLIHMYGDCWSILEAENVFGRLCEQDVATWTAMMSAYIQHGQGGKALQLYLQMQAEGVNPDQQAFVIGLQACCSITGFEEAVTEEVRLDKLTLLELGQAVHLDVRKKGFSSDIFVGNSLLNMYGKFGNVVEAEGVFHGLFQHDIVLWNAMLSTYVKLGLAEKAMQLYGRMHEECMPIDNTTLTFLLQACVETGSLLVCLYAHFGIVFAGYDVNPLVATTLIRAYGSCASMVDSHAVFDGLCHPDVVSWNACLAGCAQEGNIVTSVLRLDEMQSSGVSPDVASLLSVLTACSHASLVKQGIDFLEHLRIAFGLTPNLKHYSIMVDMLGRAGDFERVKNILVGMPLYPDLTIWLCLLSACGTHGKAKLGKLVFDYAVDSMPMEASAYVMMSNIYVDAGLDECVVEVEDRITLEHF